MFPSPYDMTKNTMYGSMKLKKSRFPQASKTTNGFYSSKTKDDTKELE